MKKGNFILPIELGNIVNCESENIINHHMARIIFNLIVDERLKKFLKSLDNENILCNK